MRINADGSVYLERGETTPMFCGCGHIYQPARGSRHSTCPKCRRRNDHEHVTLAKVNEPER